MTEASRAGETRLVAIDALRGGAALSVAVCHAITHGVLPSAAGWFLAVHGVLRWGHLGVALFFVISGFCIHLRWAKQQAASGHGQLRFFEFWQRRVHRLYPPYVVILALSMGMVMGAHLTGTGPFLTDMYPDPKPRWMALDLFAHLTMLHGFVPTLDTAGGNAPMWTLAREEYLYLLYFVVLAWRCRWGPRASTTVVLLISLACSVTAALTLPGDSTAQTIVARSALAFWIQWCLGMLAAEAYCGLVRLPPWYRSGWLVFGLAGLALLAEAYGRPLVILLWGLTFFTLVNWAVRLETTGRWSRAAGVNWLSRVGIFSYSLYLVHSPVQVLSESAVRRVLTALGVGEGPWPYLLRAVILVAVSYGAAKLFFALVERHFLHRRAPVTTAVVTPVEPSPTPVV